MTFKEEGKKKKKCKKTKTVVVAITSFTIIGKVKNENCFLTTDLHSNFALLWWVNCDFFTHQRLLCCPGNHGFALNGFPGGRRRTHRLVSRRLGLEFSG